MILIKEFEFDAAHYLPEYNGKCEKLHGHTYKLVVKIDGTPDKEGMVIDFVRLKEIVKEEDPLAFMIVSSATEIYGEGYKNIFSEKL